MTRKNLDFMLGIFVGIAIGFPFTFLLSSSNVLSNDNSKCREHFSIDPGHSRVRGPIVTSRRDYADAEGNGWKNIHVFFGNDSHLFDATDLQTPYFQANQWFSQYRQDEIVSKLLQGKRGGYFIDLAANDPVRLSNTYALETHFDWDGLCLEPNPIYWTGLSYRKCHVVAAVAGGETMEEISFRFPRAKAPKGGILGEAFDNKNDQWNEGHPRFTISLLDIFKKFKVPKVIDYISLDIEGAEDLVMASFPFSKYRFNIMTVERPSNTLSKILNDNRYIQLKIIKKNTETLWVHESILSTLDKSALEIDSQNYKFNDKNRLRVLPNETPSTIR